MYTCLQCNTATVGEFHFGTLTAHICQTCHGIWLSKNQLEALKDAIPAHQWVDVDLLEKKELMHVEPSTHSCPFCIKEMFTMNWDDGKLLSEVCKNCGGMWLPSGEYQKAQAYIKDIADTLVMEDYTAILAHQIEEVFSGKKGITEELHDLVTLLKFFQYRFIAKHPVITEVLEELPFTS